MKNNLRLVVAGAMALAGMVASSNAAETIGFKIDINHPEMIYALGEEVVFTVMVTNSTGAAVTSGKAKVSVDDYLDGKIRTREVDLAKENPIIIKETRKVPGFVRLSLEADGAKRAVRSVGFDPEGIRAAGKCPADFDEFWANARAKLAREVPLDMRMVPVPERSTAKFDFWRVSVATFGGQRVWGFLTVPKDRSKAPFPVRFMISSAGQGRWTWDFESPRDQDKVVNMSFTVYPFEPPTNQADADKLHEKMRAELKAKYGVANYICAGLGKSPEEGFFYRPILGIDRAADWLWEQPYVDRTRFCYRGGSQGGGLGMMLIAMNRKFTKAYLNVPAMMNALGFTEGLVDNFPRVYYNYWNHPDFETAKKSVAYYNGAFFAPRVKCPVRFSVGFVDEVCIPTGIYAAYNALETKDKAICHGLLRGHGSWPEGEIWEKWLSE